MGLLIFSVCLALGISFVCSLLEATLLSVTPSQVAGLAQRRPLVGAIWQHFKKNIEKPIAVILVTNTAAHTIGATIAGAQFEAYFGSSGLIIFSILFTYLMLQFTEILPKSLGVRYNTVLAPIIAPPLQVLIRAYSPILWFIHLVNRPFERDIAREDQTLEEISALAATARISRLIDPQQARIIQSASELEDLTVRQIMTPRPDVMCLFSHQSTEDVVRILKRCPYTRLPLCEDDIDHIVGMIHVKDFVKALDLVPGRVKLEDIRPEGQQLAPDFIKPGSALHVFGTGEIDLMKLRRDVVFLPEHVNVLVALRRFQDARLHLGVVVDEYGSTMGIVTLEDVIEEMVGEIRDEFDLFAPEMIHKDGDGFRINGKFPLHELAQHVPAAGIDHNEEEADTIGGFVVHRMQRLPHEGESFTLGKYRWTVSSADARRVREVVLTPHDDAASTPG
ncbi:MAG: HlyC/CorC family transporter [Candidatus Hydrogenedentes bacterium]|nr:HlyC/CorC family transporter [Candidatus Hydrogenedentota bacterium]